MGKKIIAKNGNTYVSNQISKDLKRRVSDKYTNRPPGHFIWHEKEMPTEEENVYKQVKHIIGRV